jgi:hypothetical protein
MRQSRVAEVSANRRMGPSGVGGVGLGLVGGVLWGVLVVVGVCVMWLCWGMLWGGGGWWGLGLGCFGGGGVWVVCLVGVFLWIAASTGKGVAYAGSGSESARSPRRSAGRDEQLSVLQLLFNLSVRPVVAKGLRQHYQKHVHRLSSAQVLQLVQISRKYLFFAMAQVGADLQWGGVWCVCSLSTNLLKALLMQVRLASTH